MFLICLILFSRAGTGGEPGRKESSQRYEIGENIDKQGLFRTDAKGRKFLYFVISFRKMIGISIYKPF